MTARALYLAVGTAAIVAPALHSLSDVLEWRSGFSAAQLWINYAAFVPMPWLLLGVLPLPDILQTLGTALRNVGLIAMGVAVLREQPAPS